MSTTLGGLLRNVGQLLSEWAPKLLGGALVLAVGWVLSRWAGRGVAKACTKMARADPTVARYLARLTRIAVLVVTVAIVLAHFGVQTNSIAAVLGTAGLAIGLALQSTLSNVAAGLLLLATRPFQAGDCVEIAGTSGTVEDVGLLATELRTQDGLYVLLANVQVWGNKITNHTRHGTRRVDLVIPLRAEDDAAQAIELVRALLAEDERVLAEPRAEVVVGELAEGSVKLYVRPWTRAADFWATRCGLMRRIHERLNRRAVPFP